MFLRDNLVSLVGVPSAFASSRFRAAEARVSATLGRLRVAIGPTCLPRATSIPSLGPGPFLIVLFRPMFPLFTPLAIRDFIQTPRSP